MPFRRPRSRRGLGLGGYPVEVQPRPHSGIPGLAIDSDLLGDVNGGETMSARAWRAGPGEYRQPGSRVIDLNMVRTVSFGPTMTA